MKVKELIELLKQYDEDMIVVTHTDNRVSGDIEEVTSIDTTYTSMRRLHNDNTLEHETITVLKIGDY